MTRNDIVQLIENHINLPAGAQLLDFRFLNFHWNSGIVILCEQVANHMPFVTWRVDDNGNVFSGNYFDNVDKAIEDLDNRTWT